MSDHHALASCPGFRIRKFVWFFFRKKKDDFCLNVAAGSSTDIVHKTHTEMCIIDLFIDSAVVAIGGPTSLNSSCNAFGLLASCADCEI